MAIISKSNSINVNGKTLYKPAMWVYFIKYAVYVLTAIDFIYLIATRYKGPITILWFSLMILGGFLCYVVSTNILYEKQLISTNIELKHSAEKDKDIKIKFNPTELTKEKEIEVKNIREIVAITNFLYIKLIDEDMKEVFEVSLEEEADFTDFTHFIIKNTGAYLTSM